MSNKKELSTWFLVFSGFLIIGFLVFFPVIQQNWSLSDLYDHKRLANICLVLLTILPFLFNRKLQQHWVEMWKSFPAFVRFSLLGILSIGLVSTLFAAYPVWALLEVTQYCLLFVFLIAVAVSVQQYPSGNRFLLLTSVSFAFLFLFHEIFFYINSYLNTYPVRPRASTFVGAYSFVNLRFFNQIQTLTLPLLGVAAIYSAKRNKTAGVAMFFILVGWWILVFISGARGTFLAATTGIILAGILVYKSFSKWLMVQMGGLIAGYSAYYFLFVHNLGKMERTVARSHSSGRFEIWEKMITGIIEQPLVGYGPMQSSIKGLEMHDHNYFFKIAYEWGMPAAILFTAILGIALYGFYKQIKCDEQSLGQCDKIFRTGLLAALIAAWVHSLFSGILKAPLTQIWLVLCVGTAIGIYYKTKDIYIKPAYNWKFSLFLTMSILVFVWSVYPSLSTYKDKTKRYIEKYEPKRLRPGFWQQGKIGWSKNSQNQNEIKRKSSNQ